MILVTGSNGFIGKNLAKYLDLEVVFECDIHNADYVINEMDFSRLSRVYHMGAISDTTETDIDKIYRYNIDYSIKLFQKCIDYNVPISYASSASVYGNSNTHNPLINPLNYYAMSKAFVDLWVRDNIDKFSNIRGYRFFNVYGEGEDHKGSQASPLFQFTKQAKETGVIKIFERSGDGCRDFIWVGDVCRVMLEDNRPSGIYDLGTGVPVLFSSVAEIIARKFNAKLEIISFPKHLHDKYQYYTRASISDEKCISVFEYIKTKLT